jgi:hypothetical protein
MYTDTPVPQEEAAGENPPDGAIINYFQKEAATKEVRIEILDSKGAVVRKYSSNAKPYIKPADNTPDYWVRPQQLLTLSAGAKRFLWDMRYDPLDLPASYPISAIYKNTEPNPTAPYVMPGVYTVKLIVDGNVYTQSMKVKLDPRVKTSLQDLQIQHDLSRQLYDLRKKLLAIKPASNELSALISQSAVLFDILQETDMPPTSQARKAAEELIGKMLAASQM